jgi:hypothetical protein
LRKLGGGRSVVLTNSTGKKPSCRGDNGHFMFKQ